MYKEYPKFYSRNVAEYDRKSRADDPWLTVEEVLEKHAQMMDEYAKKHLGGPIAESNKFKEVASGESIDSRPEMLRLLKAIESPDIHAVMVVDVQRLSRGDLEDAGRLIRLLRYTNTYVITPTKIYDLRDEYDRDAFERELKRGYEYLEYYKKIQARGKFGSVREGNYVGSVAPYGYKKVIKNDGKKDYHTLEIIPEEANVVRQIFHWYVDEGLGQINICKRLESMGIPTKSKKKYWSTFSVRTMLSNVHYIGCVRWNYRKSVKVIEDQKIKEKRPQAKVDEYFIFEGKHDPIVSKEVFDKAQKIMGTRFTVKPDTTLKNALSGLIYCKCGSKMGYNTFRAYGKELSPPALKCHRQNRCGNGSVKYHVMLDYVTAALSECIEDFEIRLENKQDDSIKLHKDLIAGLEAKIKEFDDLEESYWEANSHPNPEKRMPDKVFDRLNKKLVEERKVVQKSLDEAKDSAPKEVNYEERLVKFTDALEALKDPDLSIKEKNLYLREVIERIDYERPMPERITKKNVKELKQGGTCNKGLEYVWRPFKASITLRT